jgi:sugar transferase EpsL
MVVAIALLLLMFPVFCVLWVLVYLKLGRPVLFKQRRPGHQGEPFTMYKFRSMTEARSGLGDLLSDEKRITNFGQLLRQFSLDELPELFNVIKGEMSLVGPRPLLMEYLDLYTAEQMRRHEVKPGITGWTQVNGRNHLSWEEKFALDIWYVENQSFWLDLKILFLTVFKIVKREGVNQPGHVTMQPFSGSQTT